MKVTNKTNKLIKFSYLKAGDVFIDVEDDNIIYMKIAPIFSENGNLFNAVNFDGNLVGFVGDDYLVHQVNAEVVIE